MSTVKDVAELAGVSVATVSRVVNGSGKVADSSRLRVEKAISELGYCPNLAGRKLRSGRTNKIIVLIPSISHQFYSKVVSAIERSASEKGFGVLVGITHANEATEKSFVDMLRAKWADGIIFFSSFMPSEELVKLGSEYPIVQCAEHTTDKIPSVGIDIENAAYDAVSLLIEHGHRSIAMFSSKEKYISACQKEAGYLRALREHGIEESFILYDSYSYDSGARLAEKAAKLPITAIFCISDSIAIGAIKKLHDIGISVPDDISVIGFDDTSVSKRFIPALTTVAQPQKDIGTAAFELLHERLINRFAKPEFVKFPHTLIIRDTVKNINK